MVSSGLFPVYNADFIQIAVESLNLREWNAARITGKLVAGDAPRLSSKSTVKGRKEVFPFHL